MEFTSLRYRPQTAEAPHPIFRFEPAIHLCSGEKVGAFVETHRQFAEQPKFGPATGTITPLSAGEWLAAHIADIVLATAHYGVVDRPIVVNAPSACLSDRATPALCLEQITNSPLCAQEFSLEFENAAFETCDLETMAAVRPFRQRGFRVSVDARRNWTTHIPAHVWLMVDTLRIHAEQFETDIALQDTVSAASQAGVSIVAVGARWRDGEALAEHGICYGIKPRTDA
ncbi:MAG: hypothetical protein AAGK23_04400 [Pseudomonadota bacterium]